MVVTRYIIIASFSSNLKIDPSIIKALKVYMENILKKLKIISKTQ